MNIKVHVVVLVYARGQNHDARLSLWVCLLVSLNENAMALNFFHSCHFTVDRVISLATETKVSLSLAIQNSTHLIHKNSEIHHIHSFVIKSTYFKQIKLN